MKVVNYPQKWCPIDDKLLGNAKWLDFDNRHEMTFMAVESFVSKFPYLFQGMDVDILAEQFLAYQVLPGTDIPISVKRNLHGFGP